MHSNNRRLMFYLASFLILFTITMIAFPESVGGMTMLRVASWNLLAQDYVKEYKYPWTRDSPECLEWNYRKSLIVDRLLDKDMKPDIVCIQEAQVDLFSDLLSSLSPMFGGVIQNVSSTHNVGTAVLIRNSCPVKIKRMDSRSRALIVTLEDKKNPSINNLYLCSVHLDADKSRNQKMRQHHQMQRQNQLKSLLKRINLHCKLDKMEIKEAPVLVAGDFNMLRENPLHLSLTEGNLTPSAQVPLHDAYMEAEKHKRQSLPVYHYRSSREEEIDQQQQNNHQLKLMKTYKGGAILDYIWTSERIKVIDTLLYHPSSSLAGIEQWPSTEMPSDHLPIGIDMEWN